MMTSCRHERANSPAPVSNDAVAPDHAWVQEIPVASLSATDGGVRSNSKALPAAVDTPEQAKQELRACDASTDIHVDRKAMRVVSSWLEAYRVMMGENANSRVKSNSAARLALCDPGAGHQGSCDGPNASFFWTMSPYGVESSSAGSWYAHVIVRRNDGELVLIAGLDDTQSVGNECSGERAPTVSFEHAGLIYVRARYTRIIDVMAGCFYEESRADLFVDPLTGDLVFSYFQHLGEGEEDFPIESVSVVNHKVTMTGPKCHVSIKLP